MKKSYSLNLNSNLDKKTSIEVYSRSSTEVVSVETYKIRTFRSDFWPMLKYLYRVSFLTTLDIYKAYFKGHHVCRKCPSSLFFLNKLLHLYAKSFVTKDLPNLHR